ncbi:MAG: hypothetical protein ACUX7D_07595 [Candidatus Methanodesulfokora washburnensis]|jgi:hypothetical protein
MRYGISTVVVSLVLMVIGVFLAIMVYLVLSGALPSMYQRQEAALPKTNIQIINFINKSNSGDRWEVTIRNNGPVSLQTGGATEWQVFIDDRRVDRIISIIPSTTVPVGGSIVIEVEITNPPASPSSPHTVKVFGPQATQAFAGWSPKS